MLEVAKKSSADIVVARRVNAVKEETYVYDKDVVFSTMTGVKNILSNGNYKISLLGRLYSRKAIGNTKFAPKVNRYEDVTFNIEITCSRDIKLAFLDEVLYFKYDNEKSLIHTVKAEGQLPGCIYLYNLYQNKSILYSYNLFTAIVKSFLSVRYLMSIDGTTQENIKICKEYIRKLKTETRKICKGKTKMMLLFFLRFPFAYRVYREFQDPTLKTFRKGVKEKRKNS